MTEQLGRYTIIELVGSGGFAEVYKAIDTRLNRTVALKIMRPLLMSDPQFVERFTREAQTAANLDHPHIISVLDYGKEDGRLFIAMKFMEGGSLADIIKNQGPLSWDDVLRYTQQLADGLDYAHSQGLIHRDLKPANIFLDARKNAVLGDFGVVKALTGSTITMTMTGSILGTPAYIAPEIWEGEDATAATDLYAFACIVYEMITGSHLYQGKTSFAIMASHAKPPVYPASWPEDVPPQIVDILNQALSRNIDERQPTLIDFANALGSLTLDPLAAPYEALKQAEANSDWPEVIRLGESILAEEANYQDVQTRLTHAKQQIAQQQKEAELATLYNSLLTAESQQDWAAVLQTGEKILTLDQTYQDTLERIQQATQHQVNAQQEKMIQELSTQAEAAIAEDDHDVAQMAIKQILTLDSKSPMATRLQRKLKQISATAEKITTLKTELDKANAAEDWKSAKALAKEWQELDRKNVKAIANPPRHDLHSPGWVIALIVVGLIIASIITNN